ncbi:MAG: purine-nucleoside phosphorylase [Eubacteriales bacterium]
MTRERILSAYEYLKSIIKVKPDVAIILGSGLNSYADTVKDAKITNYSDIPGFPVSTAPGHKGRLIFGNIEGKNVVLMQGRFHCYEGYSAEETVIPIRAFIKLGVKSIIITNAAGGINENFNPGDLVLVKDHINFTSLTPLRGKNMDEFGERFPDMTFAYDREYMDLFVKKAKEENVVLKQGVYAMMLGPSYETPAEIRALRTLGADLVGMSTVPEVIAAAHAKVRVAVISCVTNMAAGILDKPLTHEEVIKTGKQVSLDMYKLFNVFLKDI